MRTLSIIAILWLLTSCSSDEPLLPLPGEEERIVFEKLGKAYVDCKLLWEGYDPKTVAQYITFKQNSSLPRRGYLLNTKPGSPLPEGSRLLTNYQTFGLDIAANDNLLTLPPALIDVGNGIKFPGYKVDNVDFLTFEHVSEPGPLAYLNFKTQENNWIPLFTTHELFHVFQIKQGWNRSAQKFNIAAYPLSEELLTLHLYLWEIAENAYSIKESGSRREFLRNYYVIKHYMKDLDNSADQLLTSMADYQELFEGSARYVEHFAASSSYFPDIQVDPSHGWNAMLSNAPSKSRIRDAFSHRIGYHVGAIVTKLLKEESVNVEVRYKNGETPYMLVGELLQMTEVQMNERLAMLLWHPDWERHSNRANELYEILTQ